MRGMPMETQGLAHRYEPIVAVQRYIRDHISQPLEHHKLAEMACYSEPHLNRLFAQSAGVTLAEFIRRERLERAGRKLRHGAVNITEVALAAGYATHAAFGKAFKKRYGLSPSLFRDLDCWAATQLLRDKSWR